MAELRQNVDALDGNPLGATSVDDTVVALSASMMGPVATDTRMSLVEIMGVPAAPVNSNASAASTMAPAGDVAALTGFGFGFSLAAAPAASQAEVETPQKKVKRGGEKPGSASGKKRQVEDNPEVPEGVDASGKKSMVGRPKRNLISELGKNCDRVRRRS